MSFIVEFFQGSNTTLLFGIASGILSTFAYIPYIIDTIAGRTQPQRASWLIWSVLGSIAFVSQVCEGATSSLWFAGVQITGTLTVFVFSIKAGKGRFLGQTDSIILITAGFGLVLWYITDTAAYALAITISISLLGGIATVVKAYREPDSETLVTWTVSLVASVCALLSVGAIDLIILAYPLYLFALYVAFVLAIVAGRLRDSTCQPASGNTVRAGLRASSSVLLIMRAAADGLVSAEQTQQRKSAPIVRGETFSL